MDGCVGLIDCESLRPACTSVNIPRTSKLEICAKLNRIAKQFVAFTDLSPLTLREHNPVAMTPIQDAPMGRFGGTIRFAFPSTQE